MCNIVWYRSYFKQIIQQESHSNTYFLRQKEIIKSFKMSYPLWINVDMEEEEKHDKSETEEVGI